MSSDDIDDDIRRLNLQRALKNEGTSVILAIILGLFGFLGIGHIYIGKTWRGIGLLILGWILLVIGAATLAVMIGAVFLLAYLIIFIYQIVNARDESKAFNDYFIRTRNNLW